MIEYIGFVLGVLYLLCEIRQYRLMWVLGAVSGLLYAVIFTGSGLYAAAAVQVYYVVISLYGLLEWRKGKKELKNEYPDSGKDLTAVPSRRCPLSNNNENIDLQNSVISDIHSAGMPERIENASTGPEIFYRYPSLKVVFISLGAVAVLFGVLAGILKSLTPDPMPFPDALATALSVIATYWLSKSYLYQWLIWVAVNGITVFLSLSQELYVTAVLYFIYSIAAVYGYYHWKRKGSLLTK